MHRFTATAEFHTSGIDLSTGREYFVEDVTAGEFLVRHLGHATVNTRPGAIPLELDFNGVSLLLVRPGGFGDLLFLTPIFTELRRRWPSIRLGICAFARYLPVLDGFPDIERVPYPLDCEEAARFDLLAWMEGVIERDPDARERHIVDQLASRLPMPLKEIDYTLHYHLARHEVEAAAARFPRTAGRRRIAVQLTTSARARNYPAQQMGQLFRHLHDTGAEVVLLGNPGELPEPTPDGFINLTAERPALSFRESVAVLAQCDALIAPDSVMAHVAAALRLPCVALYAAFPWELRTRPYPTTRALRGVAPCAPCFHSGHGAPFPAGQPCVAAGHCVAMATIEPQRIVRAVEKLLAAHTPLSVVPASKPTEQSGAATQQPVESPLLGETISKPHSRGGGASL